MDGSNPKLEQSEFGPKNNANSPTSQYNKKARTFLDDDHTLPIVNVDTIIEETLREDVEDFELNSSITLKNSTPTSASKSDHNYIESPDVDHVKTESDSGDDFAFTEDRVDFTQLATSDFLPADMVGKMVALTSGEEILAEILELGPSLFVELKKKNKECPVIIMESLGYHLPEGLEMADDDGKWEFVKRFLLKYVYERKKLPVSSLDDAVELIKNSKNIMVLTGAGISVSCGIPDFRSENGLYNKILEKFSLPEPECMFDIEFFKIDPEPFFSFAREILPNESIKPSFSHYFISTMEKRGQLLRHYTQNIDTLEMAAGINKVIYCHGSFSTASCLDCRERYDFETFKELMNQSLVPLCGSCGEGVIKPDIVFFGESLPKVFDDSIGVDANEVDLLLVIGSSMKVHPVSSIPDLIPPFVPQILINRESLDHNYDIELLGDCDGILCELFKRLGWGFDDESLTQRFEPLLLQSFNFSFIEPNYYIFPGSKTPTIPQSIPGSPASSEWPVNNSNSEPDFCDDYGSLEGGIELPELTGLDLPEGEKSIFEDERPRNEFNL